MKNHELVKECDDLLRAGRVQEAARKLRQVNTRQVPDNQRLSLAKLTRRTSMPVLGLRLLAPMLKTSIARFDFRAVESEVAEYAILLQRVGVRDESRKILEHLDARIVPEVNLYLGFECVARWNYNGSIPHLEEYVRSQTDPYAQLIGKVNMAAAFVHTRQAKEAQNILLEIQETAHEKGFARIQANAFELSAELKIHLRELDSATEDLRKAREILGDGRVHDQLFIRKREAQIEALNAKSGESLLELRSEAEVRGEWEIVREADLELLKIKPDEKLLSKLYAGTPFPHYRERIEKELSLETKPSLEFHWGNKKGPELNLLTGHLDELSLSHVLHRAFAALTRDLYRPRPVGALFSEIYPEQHFDVFTSPGRVHQLILRSRAFLKETKAPFAIDCHCQLYSLELSGPGGVRMGQALEPRELSQAQVFTRRLREHLGGGMAYTNEEFRSASGLEKSQVNALIMESEKEGLIRVLGKGRGTRYRLV
jgi:hypothetical protein